MTFRVLYKCGLWFIGFIMGRGTIGFILMGLSILLGYIYAMKHIGFRLTQYNPRLEANERKTNPLNTKNSKSFNNKGTNVYLNIVTTISFYFYTNQDFSQIL